ncbi:alpha/beta hydrolase [Pseudomonas capeferrum]|nr:alpha/beta hydrolase [Pseudomonas capeferrum]
MALDQSACPDWFSWSQQRPGRPGFVEVQGHRLHYLEWGEQHSQLPTLLLVHGMRAHAHWWDGIAPHLTAGRRVIAMDLPGMGDSEHWREYPLRFAAQAITGLIDCLALGAVTGIGHSYGGSRLLQACSVRPDLFRHLILLDSFLLLPDVKLPVDTASNTGKRYYPDLDTALGRYRLMPPQPLALPCIVDEIARHSLRQEAQGWCWKFDPDLPRGLFDEDLGQDLLPKVQRPVDVVFGECSLVVEPGDAQQAVDLLPLGRGPFGIPGTHHHMMIDQPLAVIAMLRGLLAAGAHHE